MEITITLDVEDWKKFQSYLEKELPKKVKSWTDNTWFIIILWTTVVFVSMALFQYVGELHWPTAGVVAFFFVLLIAQFVFNLVKFRKAFAPSETGAYVGEHHFRFDEEGIKTRGDGYEAIHRWPLVQRIERADGAIYIFLDTAFAYIFNEAKLGDPESFYNYIIGLYEKNKQ